jgi:hypothetical protein
MIAVKILNKDLWKAIKSKEINAFSMEGLATA